ncbi:hypothetical protein MATL_G00191830 [Megalops atlanticus]|uniref:Kinesin motor domain-containing protein n=1 Tax=Megalops atlanticus TaxID=7932 RepID=A0A9D3PLF1_MEGAT|nr:hypothetical protein MATL_G00191830 [Megalops atlanticus]
MSSYNSFVGSKKEEKGRNIQVVVRCRPLNSAERRSASHGVVDCDQVRREVNVRTGGIGDKGAKKTYTFDMVFGPSAKQIEVYRSVVFPIVDEVIMGYNCTVFAYGQTGTGKTFTMEGERTPNGEFTWEEDPLAGIIPRTLHQIFEKLSKNGTEFSVKVSLLEIYNEELFDLLSPSPEVNGRLQMFDDPRNKRGVVIKGLEEITVHNKDEVYQILERGAAKRKTASTQMNSYSSRSHSVFSVTIHMKEITVDGEELVKIGKLNLVDLAGSENIGRSGAVDKRAREAGNINQSLLTLGRVITALVERTPHIPYRESKLTRILQDSLGGHTKTSIIATVSPASINLEETLSTLDYANRAKNIMNKPEVNQKLTKRTLIKEYTEEIERLKRDLAAARDKNGVYVSTENFEMMNGRIVSQEEQIAEFTERISAMEEELKRVAELFSESRQELGQCTEALQESRKRLDEAHRDLQHTKLKLSEEQFAVAELKTTENALYSTANKLLSTVSISTSDVKGLHAKLDRKNAVEQHNSEVLQRFGSEMEALFTQTQRAVEQQTARQQGMLSCHRSSVTDILNASNKAFSGAISTVASSFISIRELVNSSMQKCQADMMAQESVCQEAKCSLQKVLEEHSVQLEETLLALVVPGLSAVMEMAASLKQTLQRHTVIAEQMESMKREVTSFFRDHSAALSRLREMADAGLRSLQTEQESVKQQITEASKKHETGMSQVISCLQNRLNLLGVETQTEFDGLLSLSDALQGGVNSLQTALQTECATAEQSAGAQSRRAESASDRLLAETRHVAEEAERRAESVSGGCAHLTASLSRLGQSSRQWCEETRLSADALAEEQLSVLRENRASANTLQQGVEASCDGTSRQAEEQLRQQQSELQRPLVALEGQAMQDQDILHQHRAQLSARMDTALGGVRRFLTAELRQDLPTGVTPQRRAYEFPRLLEKSRSREELLGAFRAQQQQQLQAAAAVCDTAPEEPAQQDAVEDEGTDNNDSTVAEQSFAEETLICSDGRGAPFFKRKKGGKKENRSQKRWKCADPDRPSSPSQPRLPLKAYN